MFGRNYYEEDGQAKKRFVLSVAFLYVLHMVGAAGLLMAETAIIFQALTPLNLVISAVLLLSFHRSWTPGFLLFLAITYLLGFLIEVLGVEYGVIFGEYGYGSTLGIKIWGVPLLIGLNWLMLVYATGTICDRIPANIIVKSIVATAMMVGLDFVMEPAAIKYDFWYWESNSIPVQNYLGWGFTAFCFLILFYSLHFIKGNPLAWHLYMAQLLFFLVLYASMQGVF